MNDKYGYPGSGDGRGVWMNAPGSTTTPAGAAFGTALGAGALSPREFQEHYNAQVRQHQQQIAQAYQAMNPLYAAQAQQLRAFWHKQMMEIQQTTDFKNHLLPLARIKKIMKSDEDVRMISSEAPVLFAKACEMFVLELTMRAWEHSQEGKRRTLNRSDIAAAISKTDIFDFLVDIVPRELDQPSANDCFPAPPSVGAYAPSSIGLPASAATTSRPVAPSAAPVVVADAFAPLSSAPTPRATLP